ncbi:MAG: hypothetical protein LUI60_05445 [Clostridia bacterium]|nr:hypothetical protein [Clostridia bacterium]
MQLTLHGSRALKAGDLSATSFNFAQYDKGVALVQPRRAVIPREGFALAHGTSTSLRMTGKRSSSTSS